MIYEPPQEEALQYYRTISFFAKRGERDHKKIIGHKDQTASDIAFKDSIHIAKSISINNNGSVITVF